MEAKEDREGRRRQREDRREAWVLEVIRLLELLEEESDTDTPGRRLALMLKNAAGFEGMSSTMEAIRRYRKIC
jgi:hypothetical protein